MIKTIYCHRTKIMVHFFTALLTLTVFYTGASAQKWQGRWITAVDNKNDTNTWIGYRRDVAIKKRLSHLRARIATDTKYWLWINGRMIIFEGGLKLGPTPHSIYYDEVDIAPYLHRGNNTIAVLTCFYGRGGFSHKSSGQAALLFDCQNDDFKLASDTTWKAMVMKSYKTCGPPYANYRLSESSLLYDARQAIENWQQPGYLTTAMANAVLLSQPNSTLATLVKRPIPFWKNSGLKDYQSIQRKGDTIICRLPYDAQVTPYLRVKSAAGKQVNICTDNYLFYNGGEENLRAAYITSDGEQEYETYGWLNGHAVYYIVPPGVEVEALQYRETGYDADFSGYFNSSDTLLNRLWQKAARTLYVTMRDNYMDCPDRERAQWTGDATIECEETFYALSRKSDALSAKWLSEIAGWQRSDSTLIAPVPTGNSNFELPDQLLATVGFYGLWDYYLNTGDIATLKKIYPVAKQYLEKWKINKNGTVQLRKGSWNWGDWGENIDDIALSNLWYYLAVKGQYNAAKALNRQADAAYYANFMSRFKKSFSVAFWNEQYHAFRDSSYKGKTDDRVQALAVLSGVVEHEKYPALLDVFKTEFHASPYMEKYVFEAMVAMGYTDEAIARHEYRYKNMVNDKRFTTLFEGWGVGKEGFGGGTVNHAWSGGGLTVLSKNVCGVAPLSPAYKRFEIMPNPGKLAYARVGVPSAAGMIKSEFNNNSHAFTLAFNVPSNTTAVGGIPQNNYAIVRINNIVVARKGKFTSASRRFLPVNSDGHIKFNLKPGKYIIEGVY